MESVMYGKQYVRSYNDYINPTAMDVPVSLELFCQPCN